MAKVLDRIQARTYGDPDSEHSKRIAFIKQLKENA